MAKNLFNFMNLETDEKIKMDIIKMQDACIEGDIKTVKEMVNSGFKILKTHSK